MKLVMLRHGDRDSGFGDVPLSEEGLAQAQKLADDSHLSRVDVILSSPKRRTQQTVEPLSEKTGVPVKIEPDLDQRRSAESPSDFSRRILHFIDGLKNQHPNKTVLICTHSDWLQTAILQLPSEEEDMAVHCFFGCAQYKTLRDNNGFWALN